MMPAITEGNRLIRIVVTIWGMIGALLLAGFLVWMGRQVRIIWLPLVFAAGIVVILNPLVSRLNRLGMHRVVGAAIAAAVGAVLSIPVMRLGGIWLAIATLAQR